MGVDFEIWLVFLGIARQCPPDDQDNKDENNQNKQGDLFETS